MYKIKIGGKMVDITSDVGVLNVFKNLNIKPQNALAEFIDNSVQSYLDNKEELHKIYKDKNDIYLPQITISQIGDDIVIKDNSGGIAEADEERAFQVAASNPNVSGIGTFGMGMKAGAFFATDHWIVETKAIGEDYKKIFDINLDKIINKKNTDIGPKKTPSKDRPGTTITLKDARPLHHTQVKKLKDTVGMMYRSLIKKNDIQIDFYRKQIEVKDYDYNYRPSRHDVLEINNELKDDDKKSRLERKNRKEKLQKVEWVTEFDFDLNDGFSAKGEAFIAHSSLPFDSRGFRIYWKDRVIRPKWMPGFQENDLNGFYVTKADSEINTRLSGHIFLSDNFETSFTKDEILWGGKELILIERLTKHLEKASLKETEKNQGNNKKYNFIFEATEQKYADKDFGEIKDEEDIPKPGPPDDKPWVDEFPDDDGEVDGSPDDDGEVDGEENDLTEITEIPLKHGSTNYLFRILYFNDEDILKLYTKEKGPTEKSNHTEYLIKINKAHEIFHKLKLTNNKPAFILAVNFVVALIASLETGLSLKSKTVNSTLSRFHGHVFDKVNSYLNDFSKSND